MVTDNAVGSDRSRVIILFLSDENIFFVGVAVITRVPNGSETAVGTKLF